MKNLFLYISLGAVLIFASCKPEGEEKKAEGSLQAEIVKERIAHEQKVYAEAMKAGDSYAALHAAYSLLTDDTANRIKHLDTIVNLYAKLSLGLPALRTAEKVLAIDPDNERMMDIKSDADIAQGKEDEVLQRYQGMYSKSNELKYLFKVAQVQVQIGKTDDLKNTIGEFEKHPKLATDSVTVPGGMGLETQKISGNVALIYLKGLEAARKQNYTLAKKRLNEALTLQPDFFMAKQILEDLNRPVQPRR